MFETLWQDICYGLRMLWKSPGFTIVAIIALALGIGANSAIFSVVNNVLLRPLPYFQPDRLVTLWERDQKMETSVAYLNFVDWRDQNRTLAEITAFRRETYNLTGNGEPERLQGRQVSASFFSLLGVKPLYGRDFLAEEDRPDGNLVVILGHGFWQRRFGSDASIIGKQLVLNDRNYTVIGITPANFEFYTGADIYTLINSWNDRSMKERGNHPGIYVVGRLKPGITIEQARDDLNAIQANLGKLYPKTNTGRSINISKTFEDLVGDVKPMLWILVGAVAFVLLIACANVANLLLARATVRQHEIAIRTALGATRIRVIRQLLTESLLLALLGGLLGMLLALWGTDLLLNLVPEGIPRLQHYAVDLRVLAFTFTISMVTGVIFGVIPALQSSKSDLNDTLKDRGRGNSGRQYLRNSLVVAEVALALVLLIGAGLMIRSFLKIQQVNTGFQAQNLLTIRMSVSPEHHRGVKLINFIDQIHEQVGALPGVSGVSISAGLPYGGASEESFHLDGQTAEPGNELMAVQYIVSPSYFQTMGIQLMQGRIFNERDTLDSPFTTIVDEEFARQYFPNQNPLGQLIRLGGPELPPIEVIGVVKHVKHYGSVGPSPVQAQFYFTFKQVPVEFLNQVGNGLVIEVRSNGPIANLADSVRKQIYALDKDQPVFNVHAMNDLIAGSIAPQRFAMLLLTIFAVIALLLASVGIYGVISYSVTQRTQEIGIRMALGAQQQQIFQLVVGQGIKLTLLGIGIGLLASLALMRVLSSLLFDVSVTDPTTFAGIALILLLVAMFACYWPARKAMKVDPLIALRYE